MTCCRKFYLSDWLFFLFILAGLSSCEKFEGDQTVPSYLKIDSIRISTDYSIQGSESQAICDAWVYIDDVYLGTFELPARVPVLKTGKHKVSVLPGIKKDGIATTRVDYPFYKPFIKTINFSQDSTTSLGLITTTYTENSEFIFKEDFEQVSLNLDTTPASIAYIQKTPGGSPFTFEGDHSAKIVLDSTHEFFECVSHDPMDIPRVPVYCELNFNATQEFTVGVIAYSTTMIYQSGIVTLRSTNGQWKKVYIYLNNTLNSYPNALKFRLYIGTYRDATVAESQIHLDNLKIVTTPAK